MKFLLVFSLVMLNLRMLSAADVGTPCVFAESEFVLRVRDVIALNSREAERCPEAEYNDKGQFVGLKWMPKGLQALSESEKIAEVGGREIRRFVFWNEGGNKDGDGVVCVWLGFQTTMPDGGVGYRPFLVLPGDDQVRDWESYCTYDVEDGFCVVMHHSIKGNGAIWERIIVQFKKEGPVPLRVESGGRGLEEPNVRKYR